MTKLINKISTLETDMLIEVVREIGCSDEEMMILQLALDELESRMTESEFLSFCNTAESF